MANLFQHVIFTRFNLRNGFGRKGQVSDDWMAHRCEIFERYCLPSVQSQSCGNFRWLVFFDEATPAVFRKRIECYTGCSQLTAIFARSFDKHTRRAALDAHLPRSSKYLISTRLDNDDALSTDFVFRIQAAFRSQRFEFLNVPHGYVWHEQRVFAYAHPSNAFLTLVERNTDVQTVYCAMHSAAHTKGTVRQLGGGPGWLQVVHGRNVSNRIRGRPATLEELQSTYSFTALTDALAANTVSPSNPKRSSSVASGGRCFNHVVLTRVGWNESDADRGAEEALARISREIDQLKWRCTPSLLAQTCQQFIWIILHERRSAGLLDEQRALVRRFEAPVHFLSVKGFSPRSVRKAMSGVDCFRKEWIITSRLSPPDVINRDYIERIQRSYHVPTLTCAMFATGVVSIDDRLLLCHNNANPFLSVMERSQDCQTVFRLPYLKAATTQPVSLIPGDPGWIVRRRKLDTRTMPKRHLNALSLHTWFPPRALEGLAMSESANRRDF